MRLTACLSKLPETAAVYGSYILIALCLLPSSAGAKSVEAIDGNEKPYSFKHFVAAIRLVASPNEKFSTTSPSMQAAKSLSDFLAGPHMRYVQTEQALKFSYLFGYVAEPSKEHNRKGFCQDFQFNMTHSLVNILCNSVENLYFRNIEHILGKPKQTSRGPYDEIHGTIFPSMDKMKSEIFRDGNIDYSAIGSDDGRVSEVMVTFNAKSQQDIAK